MKIYKPAGMPSYAFVDDPDDDEPVKRVNAESEEEEKDDKSKGDGLVEDSDDSEDEESADELDVEDDESEDEAPTLLLKRSEVGRKKEDSE